MWFINLAILIICLIKVLFYGDPYIIEGSKASKNLKSKISIAESQFKNNKDPETAFESFSLCLNCFGISLPKTRVERCVSFIWQFIRMILYGIIGKLFAKTNLYKPRSDILCSAKELAHIYHRLNQISLTSGLDDQNGFLISLCSINTMEVAENIIEPHHIAEVYFTAALRAKAGLLKFMSRLEIILLKFLSC